MWYARLGRLLPSHQIKISEETKKCLMSNINNCKASSTFLIKQPWLSRQVVKEKIN